jgi:hypothetical protein
MIRQNALLWAAALLCSWLFPAFAIELTEPAGAEHGYPGLCDINGNKLANGEFRQWLRDERLNVVITYKFPDGQLFEEKARFRQNRELMQKQWSWRELKHDRPQREFSADFVARIARAQIHTENKDVSGDIDVEPGRTFAGFGFTIALSNLRTRLIKGQQIELKALGFAPKPFLKPMVVPVKIWHPGLEQMKMGGRYYKGDNFAIRPEIPAIAKIFVHVPDTHIWLTNPMPGGFLRWEGPIVLPNDPMIRVDLISDHAGGPAEPVKSNANR